jgi:hypothetical protein
MLLVPAAPPSRQELPVTALDPIYGFGLPSRTAQQVVVMPGRQVRRCLVLSIRLVASYPVSFVLRGYIPDIQALVALP